MTFFKQNETEEQIETIFERLEIQSQNYSYANSKIKDLEKEILVLKFQLEHSIPSVKENNGLVGRIEDLEVWRAKVHSMMIMTNPISKKERLSPIAKRWGEKYQS